MILGIAVSEAILRLTSANYFHGGYLPSSLVLDAELGFRPQFDETNYSSFGTRVNEYPADKNSSIRRILVIGDSVVASGSIVERICDYLGNRFECWNGGVGSYNTAQQAAYLRRYLLSVEPDEVILFFHLNDFYVTPSIATDDTRKLFAYVPGGKTFELNYTLFLNSYVYRALMSSRFPRPTREEARRMVAISLRKIASLVTRGRFRVVVMPYFKELAEWTNEELADRNDALSIISKLDIQHTDLLPALTSAEASQMVISKSPGDFWHPSASFEALMVESLIQEGFFESAKNPPD